MRNVSFAVSVTRLRTPRIGPARPLMAVSSVTSRSIVWTTDSCGSTYPEGIVHRPFEGPYVLRTTRRFPARTRNAPAPTVIGRVATFRAMAPVRSPNEMALSQVSFLGHLGEAMQRKVTFTPRRFLKKIWQLGNFDVSPDGRWLAFAANKGDQWSVYLLDLRTKKDRILLQSEQSVLNPEFSPDGRWIAVQSDFEGDENYNIYLVPVRGAHVQKITDTPFDSAFPRWSPDGRELAFISNVHDHVDLGVLDVKSKKVRFVVQSRWDKAMPLWAPDGKRIAFLENRDGNVQLKTVSRDGKGSRAMSPAKGSASRAVWTPDAKGLFYQHSEFTQSTRLILRRGERAVALVDSLREPLPKDELAVGKLVRYPSFDGRTISAWLFVPRKERRRNAALVDPHGGPESQTINDWDPRFQFMAAEGFTILAPNYRGGTGNGRAWRRLSDRDLGGGDVQDIIAGGRWLIQNRHCAPDRLGAIGVSYGGYAVAHVLEKAPDLWAVGVSIVGYFNWLTATTIERGYLRRYDRQKMGEPEVDADLYRKFSPIYFLDEIRAPVLFTGGAHDPRCPVTEARAMVEEMRKMGKVVDYLEFADEGHWPRKISNQIRLNDRTSESLAAVSEPAGDLGVPSEAGFEAFLLQERQRPVEGGEHVRGNRRRGGMPFPPLPLVPVPGVEVEIPSFDGLRIRGLPERPRDCDGRDAGGRRDALLGRTGRRFDPELREGQRDAAEGRDRVDDHGRIRGVRGLDDRLQGIRDARRGLVVHDRDGLRRRLQGLP